MVLDLRTPILRLPKKDEEAEPENAETKLRINSI
jgi:hypothetical protein